MSDTENQHLSYLNSQLKFLKKKSCNLKASYTSTLKKKWYCSNFLKLTRFEDFNSAHWCSRVLAAFHPFVGPALVNRTWVLWFGHKVSWIWSSMGSSQNRSTMRNSWMVRCWVYCNCCNRRVSWITSCTVYTVKWACRGERITHRTWG